MSGDNSVVDPPNSMPNLEVKRNSADGSVGPPHVRVGHRQTPNFECLTIRSGVSKLSTKFNLK